MSADHFHDVGQIDGAASNYHRHYDQEDINSGLYRGLEEAINLIDDLRNRIEKLEARRGVQ